MTYKVFVGQEANWSSESLSKKLKALGALRGRKAAWIRHDLTLGRSNCITRFIWTCVAKHFKWMRTFFYKVDLDQTRRIFKALYPQINKTDNHKFKKQYFAALSKFNQIAPNHFYHPDMEETIQKHLKESSFREESVLQKMDLFPLLSKKQILQLCRESKKGWISQVNEGINFKFLGMTKVQLLELVKTEGKNLTNLVWSEPLLKLTVDEELAGIIRSCPNLTRLRIEFTPLSNQLIQSIANLKNLKSLSISNPTAANQLDFSPLGKTCHQLESLFLEGCNLSQFPVEFGNLTKLNKLSLINANLGAVDITLLENVLLQLQKLEELDLSKNKLSHLPESLSALPMLHSLKLKQSEFLKFPASLGKLGHLTSLEMNGAHLPKNPNIDKKRTPMSEMDLVLEKLTKLEDLNLSAIGLDALPQSLSKLTELQTLNLSSNFIQTLPEEVVLPLIKLRTLDLRYTGISSQPPVTIKLPALRECKVSPNFPHYLPWQTSFFPNKNLEKIKKIYQSLYQLPNQKIKENLQKLTENLKITEILKESDKIYDTTQPFTTDLDNSVLYEDVD